MAYHTGSVCTQGWVAAATEGVGGGGEGGGQSLEPGLPE